MNPDPHLTLTLSPPIRMGAERGKQMDSIHIRTAVWHRQVQGFNARTFPRISLPACTRGGRGGQARYSWFHCDQNFFEPLKCSSISSSVLPLVSGNQKAAVIK